MTNCLSFAASIKNFYIDYVAKTIVIIKYKFIIMNIIVPAQYSLSGLASRVVRFAAGGVLLCAAILKGFQLSSGLPADDFMPSRSTASIAVIYEAVLGIWLLSGLTPRTVRALAVITFLIFFAIAVHHITIGRKSCGCFGAVEVAPFVSATFDFLLVIALMLTKPPAAVEISVWGAVAIFAGVTALAIPAWQIMDPVQVTDRLDVSPPAVDLGVIGRGQCARAMIRLANHSGEQVQLHTYETSCPCLTLEFGSQVVQTDDWVAGTVILDMAHEPAFTGLLGITVKGYAADHRLVYQFKVTAEVQQ